MSKIYFKTEHFEDKRLRMNKNNKTNQSYNFESRYFHCSINIHKIFEILVSSKKVTMWWS